MTGCCCWVGRISKAGYIGDDCEGDGIDGIGDDDVKEVMRVESDSDDDDDHGNDDYDE